MTEVEATLVELVAEASCSNVSETLRTLALPAARAKLAAQTGKSTPGAA